MDPTPVRPRTRAEARGRSPVFLDHSGRRLRRIRAVVVLGIAAVGAYLVLAIASLFGAPAVDSPLLPQPLTGVPIAVTPLPTPTPAMVAPSPVATPKTSPSASETSSPPQVEPIVGEAGVTPAPASAPTPTATASPSAAPGNSADAPGRSNPPTPPGRK